MQTQARGGDHGGIEARAGAVVHRVAGWARQLVHELVQRRELLRQRRGLLELDDHLLKDIGLRREDALREADRLLWQDALGPRLPWLPLRRADKRHRSQAMRVRKRNSPLGGARELPE